MEDLKRTPKLDFYVQQVEAYERESKPWESRSKKIVKRYRDQRGELARKLSQFNILWSNVQTLHPALYDGSPTPNVDRRFEDDEEVNTTVANILERSVSYFVKTNDFDDCMNQAVLDRLLSGRGTVWVRYVPNFKDAKIQGDKQVQGDGKQITDDVEIEELYSEDVVLDYVHWCDYGHNVCRTWQENRMVWRRVFMDKKAIQERFPETCMVNGKFAVPLDATTLGKAEDDKSESASKGSIYELWDRTTKRVVWFHKDMADFLDEQEDPLGISGFYPCPKPLYATLGNDSMIPTPDFVLYQDQANELDSLTGRIDALSKALKVVGVYDSSAEGVQRMLSENVDNRLIPVEQWAVFAEKGGIKGVVDFMPIEMVANVLIQLYAARDKVKQDIYEITGISDIVRGATNAGETATAQRIKGQFATLRLDNMQKEVARFSRDCVRIKTEIIAEHFSIETLKNISGVRLLTQAEKQQAQMAMQPQIDPMTGQPKPPQPLPEHIMKLMEKPTWEEIEFVLRDNGARCFRIDIETDSTIKADQDADKAARIEFLTAAGGFIQQAAQIQAPELQPLLMQMLKFGVGSFKAGRELEAEFKVAADAIKAKQDAPPAPPPPDPAIEKAKLDAQIAQDKAAADIRTAQKKAQSDIMIAEQKAMAEMRIKEAESAANVELKRHEYMHGVSMKERQVGMEPAQEEPGESQALVILAQMMQQNAEAQQLSLQALNEAQNNNTQEIIGALNREKKVQVMRDAGGKMVSAEIR